MRGEPGRRHEHARGTPRFHRTRVGSLLGKHKGVKPLKYSFWVSTLLTDRELVQWVSETVEEFDMKFDHLLTGAEFTEQDKWLYERQNVTGNPFVPNAL